MKKRIIKGMTMAMLTVALTLVSAVASANAQGREVVRAAVPFEYIVGSQTLAAGDCRIANSSDSGQAIVIRNLDTKESAARLTRQLFGESKQSKLVFHRYGNRYFLAEVWTGEGGVALLKSKQEKAIERETAMIDSRKNLQARYETVVVSAAMQ